VAGESPDTSERDRERASSLGEGQSPRKTPKDPATVPLAAGVPAARAKKNGGSVPPVTPPKSGPEQEQEPDREPETEPEDREESREEGQEGQDEQGEQEGQDEHEEERDRPEEPEEPDEQEEREEPEQREDRPERDASEEEPARAEDADDADEDAGEDQDADDEDAGAKADVDEEPAAKKAAPSLPKDQPTTVFPRSGRSAALPKDKPTTALRVSEDKKPGKPTVPPQPSAPPAVPPKPPAAPAPAPAVAAAAAPAAPPAPPVPPPPRVPPPPADSERDPLELLAALTNRPPPPPTPWRTAVRRFKIYTPVALLLLIVLATAQALRPLPDPSLELTAAETFTFEGETPTVPWPETGQAALGVDGVGSFGTSGEQKPVPIASVAKVMTAYLILRDHPLEPGAEGPGIPIDQQAEDDAGLSETEDESTVDVRAGDTISEYEALQAIMIASANNVARLLARWDADSEEAFVEKMNEAAAELGMDDTTYTDPSGLNEDTVSTAADQVRLAEAAMADPVFREVVGVSAYEDSYGVEHRNYNYLVPVDGVIGIKPGTTSAAGGCLLFAAEQEVAGERQLILGAVLGQPPAAEDNSILTGALNAGKTLIDFAQEELTSAEVFSSGDVVGEVDDGLGGSAPVTVAEKVTAVGWPGLEVGIELAAAADGIPHTADAGTGVGELRMGNDDDGVTVPVRLAEELVEPGLSTRLRRLG
jgi:serine-type D-Ala-D-Ala carboxypeptidase (penicillin-binding protein 5/6)